MSTRGVESRIYTSFANPHIVSSMKGDVEIVKAHLPEKTPFQLYSSLLISKRLIDLAASWADAIILHSGVGMAEYGWRKHGLPCIPFFHVDNYDPTQFAYLRGVSALYTYPLRLHESKCIRRVPLAFANSRSLRGAVQMRVKGGRLTVIPLGVNIDRFRPTWNDDQYILMVGRFHPANNFELGIRAAANASCKIVIGGIRETRFLWYYRHIREVVNRSRELSDRVEFLTPDDDELIGLLQNCALFLSPRLFDYLGLAALEAMACGKPVIAYNAEQDSQYLPVLQCGDQYGMWKATLETLMSDRTLREKIGRESRQFVEIHHTLQRTVDLMLDKIKGVLYNEPS
jgi:glycosyltransferase involved in cell wall biosynthesis